MIFIIPHMNINTYSALAAATEAAVNDTAEAFDDFINPLLDLLDRTILPAVLAVVGSPGALFCVLLGVKYAKAEEPQDREKAKAHLKNAIIGFVLIFFLMLALKLVMPAFIKWVADNGTTAAYI